MFDRYYFFKKKQMSIGICPGKCGEFIRLERFLLSYEYEYSIGYGFLQRHWRGLRRSSCKSWV